VESARLLLAAGANVNDKLPDGTTALIEAAHSGQGAVAALLLEKGRTQRRGSRLHGVACGGAARDLALVKALLAHHANPNLPLTKATQTKRANGHEFEMLAPLLGSTPYAGSAVSRKRHDARAGGRRRRHAPAETGRHDTADARRRHDGVHSGGSPQPPDAGRRQIEDESQVLEGVTTALALGADVNAVNRAGDTALHTAAAQGFTRVVQLLADSGASLSIKNKAGLTPRGAGYWRAAPNPILCRPLWNC
jgi:ankyrin repeat protein